MEIVSIITFIGMIMVIQAPLILGLTLIISTIKRWTFYNEPDWLEVVQGLSAGLLAIGAGIAITGGMILEANLK